MIHRALPLCFFIGGCVSPPPFVIVSVEDPHGLAGGAATLAYGEKLGDLTEIPLEGERLPTEFILHSKKTSSTTIWVEARERGGQPIGRGRVAVVLTKGETGTVVVQLGYVCHRALTDGEHCALAADDDGVTYTGVCPAAGDCQPSVCGDGVVDREAGQACDEGTADTATCDYADGTDEACTLPVCGDGYVNELAGETCDDGVVDTLSCDYAAGSTTHWCTPAMCGDGYPNAAAREACDDGNAVIDDGCHPICTRVAAPRALNLNTFGDKGDDLRPRVATDGAGNWVAVWSHEEASDHVDILVARSGDNGDTWTAPLALIDNAVTDLTPEITTDGAGHWVVVWDSGEDIGGIGTDRDILVARSTDNGASWTTPVALGGNAVTDGDGSDLTPQIATDGGGHWVTVWASNTDLGSGTDYDIFVARSTDHGTTWTGPELLNAGTETGLDIAPKVACDGDGTWIAVWESSTDMGGIGTDADVLMSRSTDHGESWTVPAPLNNNASTDTGYDFAPDIAADGAGNWIAVWMSTEPLGGAGTDQDIFVSRSVNDGVTWTDPALLNNDALTDIDVGDDTVSIGTDGAGNWVAAWRSYDGDADIFSALSVDNGATWTDPQGVNEAGDDFNADYDVDIATDGAGMWLAVWSSDDPFWELGEDFDIFVSTSVSHGTAWASEWPLGTTGGADFANDFLPAIAADGAGHVVAVWETYDGIGAGDYEIAVTISSDAGVTWTLPAFANADAATESRVDRDPAIATDGEGTWVVVWEGEDPVGPDAVDIWVARSTDHGATWSAPYPLNTNASTDSLDDLDPQIAVDAAGHWVVVWSSEEYLGGVDADIFVARSADGGVTWTGPTALNTNATTDAAADRRPQIATDKAGLWIATWLVSADATDIFISRSTDHGATWTPPSFLAPTVEDAAPHIATDGGDHWVAVWKSDLNPDSDEIDDDIWFSRSEDGGVTWATPTYIEPRAGSDATHESHPRVACDVAGNWVAVWHGEGIVGSDFDTFVTRSVDHGRTWSVPAALNTNAGTAIANNLAPYAAPLGDGRWMAAWSSNATLGGVIGNDFDILFTTFSFP